MIKKIFILLAGLSAVLLIVYFILFRCNVSDEEAIRLSKEFCNKFDISCQGNPDISTLPCVLPSLTGGSISDAFNRYKYLSFNKEVSFNVACQGGIYSYYNSKIREDVASKYRTVVQSEGYPVVFHTYWAENISEAEAMKIIDSLAAKIGILEDMVFDKITKRTDFDKTNNDDSGFWIAHWVRKRDGYKYEFDRIEMSIMRSTGDFVDYRKAYKGSPCSTVTNISKEKATELAWNKLREIVGEKAWKNISSRYSITSVEPLIVQPNVCFGRPCSYRSKQSRLAWVINFAVEIKPHPGKVSADEAMRHTKSMVKQWKEMGEPPIAADIRIDAETGKYLGGRSEDRPWN